MKKICRTIKLRRFKTRVDINQLASILANSGEFIICFDDNTWQKCLSKEELRSHLEREHIKGIRYIFEFTDRITLDRDVLINTEEVKR